MSSKNTLLTNNIFDNIPEKFTEEIIENIFIKQNLVIERIVSNGHSTLANHWYDQLEDEWLILLKGEATILLETNNQLITASNEPAADNAGSRGSETWLGLLNMETKIEDKTCYRPHMRLPAGRYAA